MASSSSEDDDEDLYRLAQLQQTLALVVIGKHQKKKKKRDHRSLPREAKKQYEHQRAYQCIMKYYLGSEPLFDGREFDASFRISRRRFQRLLEDFGNSGIAFYAGKTDCFGYKGASLEARLLLPLKCMAYGVPPHCFRDYFSMSKTLA